MSRDTVTVFQEKLLPGAGFETGDFVEEKGVGGATVERLVYRSTLRVLLPVQCRGRLGFRTRPTIEEAFFGQPFHFFPNDGGPEPILAPNRGNGHHSCFVKPERILVYPGHWDLFCPISTFSSLKIRRVPDASSRWPAASNSAHTAVCSLVLPVCQSPLFFFSFFILRRMGK